MAKRVDLPPIYDQEGDNITVMTFQNRSTDAFKIISVNGFQAKVWVVFDKRKVIRTDYGNYSVTIELIDSNYTSSFQKNVYYLQIEIAQNETRV